jgi:hypothetical protein
MPNGADSQAPPMPASLRWKRRSRFMNAASSWHCRATAVLSRLTSIRWPVPVRSRWNSPTKAEKASSRAVEASTIELPDGVGGSSRRPP